MQTTSWVVITGPPSSGKTSLINALAAQGYRIAAEVAREIICYTLGSARLQHQLPRNSLALQREILAVTLRREHRLPVQQRIFFDRGAPDSIAYLKYHHFNPKVAYKACEFRRYAKVFYCQGLPIVKDDIRIEDEWVAQKLGQKIMDAYESLGYFLHILPPVSIEERLELILRQLQDSIKPEDK